MQEKLVSLSHVSLSVMWGGGWFYNGGGAYWKEGAAMPILRVPTGDSPANALTTNLEIGNCSSRHGTRVQGKSKSVCLFEIYCVAFVKETVD